MSETKLFDVGLEVSPYTKGGKRHVITHRLPVLETSADAVRVVAGWIDRPFLVGNGAPLPESDRITLDTKPA